MNIFATILTIITLVSCLMMFFVRRELKVGLLLMGTMTMTLVNIPYIPLHKANMVLPLFFILSEWQNLRNHLNRIWQTRSLRIAFAIVIFSTIVCALTTKYIKPWPLFRGELIFKYFALAYAFMSVKDERTLKSILKISIYCLIALTFFGILNYIDRSAELVNALTKGKTNWVYDVAFGDLYSERDRFRVQSMFKSPFDYGYICTAMLLLHIHGWYQHLENKKAFWTAVVCCTFGIITCACRIVWVSALFSVICYYVCCFRLSRNILLGIAVLILSYLSYNFIPAVEEKVNTITNVFAEESETGGSSIKMRTIQFASTLSYVEGKELFGNGKGFFTTEIWNPDAEDRTDSGLYGLESVIFSKLLERGYFGFVLWAAFYLFLFLYFRRQRHTNMMLSGLGVSILSLYLMFAIGTGELNSVYPTMLLLGFIMKSIESNKKSMRI